MCIKILFLFKCEISCFYGIVSSQVCLQDVLVEIDEDNYLPETTRTVIQDLYEDFQDTLTSILPSSPLPRPPRLDSPSSGTNEAPVPVAEHRRETIGDSGGRAGCAEGSISTEGSGSITVPGQSQEKATSSTEESVAGILRVPSQGLSTEGEGLVAVPNLHHLLQLIEAVRRNSCYLQLTMAQAASLLTFEAGRVFSSITPSESVLRKRINGVIKKYFEEVTCLPRQGERNYTYVAINCLISLELYFYLVTFSSLLCVWP